jgi:hypothetical protein
VPQLPDIAEQLSRLVGAPVTLTFGLLLAVHILAGLICVITGAVAFLSKKHRGRHPAFGEVYYWALAVVFATATGMAGMRWAQSAYLFVLGCIAFCVWITRLCGAKAPLDRLADRAHAGHEPVLHRAHDRVLRRQWPETARVGSPPCGRLLDWSIGRRPAVARADGQALPPLAVGLAR